MGSLSVDKAPRLRDASFSSYLNPSEEAFIRKLVETSKIPNSTITIQKENVYIGKKKVEDGEIGVFGAEKYFNGGIDDETFNHQHSKIQELNSKVNIQARTPSVHSESSWNSQSGLLRSGRNKQIHNENAKRRQGKSFLSTLSCKCSCGDKNFVDIDEHTSESFPKQSSREVAYPNLANKSFTKPRIMEEMRMKKDEDGFTFPIVSSKTINLETKLVYEKDEDEKNKEAISLESKLDLFTLDTKCAREEIDGNFEDFESDASSDLFEIQSFSTTNNSNPYLLRQASNSSPVACYAPSEASIEWSVVTASAAGSSFISDFDYPKSTFLARENARKMTPDEKAKRVEKRRPGILSGCKSQKDIRVVGDAYITNQKVVSDTKGQHKLNTNQNDGIDSRKGLHGVVPSMLNGGRASRSIIY